MVFQLAIPVHSRITAPIAMAITDVSPIEPGINPTIISHTLLLTGVCCAMCARGVAIVKPSGNVFPNPKILSLATHTVSPVILLGYEKNRNIRAPIATFTKFIPVPPNISLQKITEKATANANIHKGVVTGIINGIIIPVTKKPSCISSPFHCAQANSIPKPTI